MSPDDWIKYCSDPRFLGGKRMSTQHLLGAAKFIKISDTEITAHYQVRAAHVRWKDDARTKEGFKGHGHGELVQHYKKLDGIWKLAGWKPSSFWDEHEFSKVVEFGLTQPLSEL
jgi:scytalone dehydratase